jgi:inhibitor of KinA
MQPEIKPAGDSTILISFGEVIDEGINDRVHAIASAIENASPEWLVEVVSAYSSLLVFLI